MEQHERQEQDSTAATTDAMDVDGQQQHGMIADKLKDAARSTQPKTKEEEILREKLKDAIKIKLGQRSLPGMTRSLMSSAARVGEQTTVMKRRIVNSKKYLCSSA